MILSDRDIRAELDAGRIVIDPFMPDAVQPSSVGLPDDLVARLEGRSSLGRLGLLIHSTAGYVDPGWEGTLTLELSNVANLPIKLYDGMKIGQISFQRLTSAAEVPYGDARIGSRYRGQTDRTASRYHADFERGRIVRR